MPIVHYPHSKLYVGNRPLADVVLLGPAGRSSTFLCLVDSGADYLQLPAAAAGMVGLALAGGTPHPTLTASGSSVALTKLSGVQVEIEGKTVVVDVLFGPTLTPPPLGRQALLAAYEVGLNTREWLRL
jgi:predicted aspartyl protease